MAETRYLDDDIVKLYAAGQPRKPEHLVATLFWGDSVRWLGKGEVEIFRRSWSQQAGRYQSQRFRCALPPKARFRPDPLLKVRFIDVGQGDGAMVETPAGKILLIDGGEEEHLRRYVNVAFAHVLRTRPLDCAAIVVTHGDADHFAGLTRLLEGTRGQGSPMVSSERVFHNGLVKRGSPKRDVEAFGRSVKQDGVTYAVELEDDLLQVPDSRMNKPFLAWKAALAGLKKHTKKLAIRRLAYGDDAAFAFLAEEGVGVRVLGPIVDEVKGKPALRFLRTPGGGSLSASHTVNGHSIVLKLSFGNVRFLFGADLNEESEDRLLERAGADQLSLAAEVLKVPHHGSADFSPRMLEAIRPVVSVVSSGDENTTKEYIHPRAGLVGALGKYSRATVEKPLVYVTEMVAFMERLGTIEARRLTKSGAPAKTAEQVTNAYRKRAFGIVHVRTDGERVLVATHSGKDEQKESYAFRVDPSGAIAFEETSVL